MNIVGYQSPFKKISSVKPSPMKLGPIAAIALAAAPGLIQAGASLFGRKARLREQRRAREEMKKARAAFEAIEYVNPYADLTNPYAENIYEDMTVDTQAADYLKQQQQQSQANIMQQFRGVAGGSGISALAQSLSNIAAGQAQQASAQIAQQERSNEALRLQGAQRKQEGQFGVDKMKAYGEALRRQQEDARTEALFGLSIQRKTSADRARQLARQQFISGIGSAAAGVAGLYAPSGSLAGTGNPFASTPSTSTTNPSEGLYPSTGEFAYDMDRDGVPDFFQNPND